MSDNTYMNGKELLEFAALDVLGLLDEYEAEQFHRSFHHAPANVQDQVIALQADIAADPVFQSEERPAGSLRERVLERVSRALEDEAKRLAPIATIGRGRYSGVVDPGVVRSLHRSSLIWRGVSFALAASLLLTLVLYMNATRSAQEIVRLALDRLAVDELKDRIGPDLEQFINSPTSELVAFRPATPNTTGIAGIWLNEKSGQVLVLGLDLVEGSYTLRARTSTGASVDIRDFQSDGSLASRRVDEVDLAQLGVSALSAITWEIIDGAGNVILTTA